jgi:hypothetical protein
LAFVVSTFDLGGVALIVGRIWTDCNASNPIDPQQAFQKLPQPLKSVWFWIDRFR